jgi:hypothetical protein
MWFSNPSLAVTAGWLCAQQWPENQTWQQLHGRGPPVQRFDVELWVSGFGLGV